MEKIMKLGEEEKEIAIQKRNDEIKLLFLQSKKKDDYDYILKKFSMKYIKNKKKRSPMALKIEIKKKIIQMAMHEPEDLFDYDYWIECQNPIP